MNLQHLHYFVELAHTRNYTLAAQNLHITQPSLSYAISQLENELNVPLFLRSGKTTELTTYGREFLTYAENALRMIELGVDAVNSRAVGETVIRIGFLRFLGVHYVPHIISGFQREHPEFRVRFEVETGFTANLMENLDRLDVVFCAPSRRYQKMGSKIGHQRLYLIVPEGHPLSSCREVRLEDTFQYSYIYYPKGTSTRSIIEHHVPDLYEKINISYEIMEERVVAGFIAAGFGIGILPEMALLETLPVMKIEIAEPQIGRDIFMIPSSTREMTPALAAFLKYVRNHPWDEV